MGDWVEENGLRTKTVQYGVCTIIIQRPILDAAEAAKREKEVMDIVATGLRDYYKRKDTPA